MESARRWRVGACGMVLLALTPTATLAQTFPPNPEDRYIDHTTANAVEQVEGSESLGMVGDFLQCRKTQFDQKLQLLRELAQGLQQHLQRDEAQAGSIAPGTEQQKLTAVSRQRASLSTKLGQDYADSINLNRTIAWYASFSWAHCLPAGEKSSSVVQHTSPPGGGSTTGLKTALVNPPPQRSPAPSYLENGQRPSYGLAPSPSPKPSPGTECSAANLPKLSPAERQKCEAAALAGGQ